MLDGHFHGLPNELKATSSGVIDSRVLVDSYVATEMWTSFTNGHRQTVACSSVVIRDGITVWLVPHNKYIYIYNYIRYVLWKKYSAPNVCCQWFLSPGFFVCVFQLAYNFWKCFLKYRPTDSGAIGKKKTPVSALLKFLVYWRLIATFKIYWTQERAQLDPNKTKSVVRLKPQIREWIWGGR